MWSNDAILIYVESRNNNCSAVNLYICDVYLVPFFTRVVLTPKHMRIYVHSA